MSRKAHRDFPARFAALEERVRRLEVDRSGHTESKTFIVGGLINTAVYIPPLFVGIDQDGLTPEWKQLNGFSASTRAGTVFFYWYLNGGVVALTTATPTSASSTVDLAVPIDLNHGDTLRPLILGTTSDASDLSACAFIVTAPT